MAQPRDHVPGEWVVIPAVQDMMDEDGYSGGEALAALRDLLGAQAPSRAMRETLDRLAAVADEGDDLTFRAMLGAECLRLMALDDAAEGEPGAS